MAVTKSKQHRLWVSLVVAIFMQHGIEVKAAEPLRYGVLDSMFYPLVTHDSQGKVSGGLLHDLGTEMSRELGTSLQQVLLSRKRLENALQGEKVDLVCFLSPQWLEQPEALQWSIESLLQVERLVTRRGNMVPKLNIESLAGKRIATQLGYRYPGLQSWFEGGRVTRVDQTRVALMFKAIEVGSSDALVTSEDEIEGYFNSKPQARLSVDVSPFVVSRVATQCAVSNQSRYSLASINKALAAIAKRGDLGRMAAKYRLSSR